MRKKGYSRPGLFGGQVSKGLKRGGQRSLRDSKEAAKGLRESFEDRIRNKTFIKQRDFNY